MANSLAEAWFGSPVGRVAAPLREQVVDALTEAIMARRLMPGQRLVERELVEQLGVSRTTVREAIRELSSQGLVTVVPQRGAVVSSPTLEEARDLYDMRAAIESVIVRRFVERATDEQIDQLDVAVEGFAAAAAGTDDVNALLTSKSDFYRVLLEGAGGTVFRQLIESLQVRVQLLRATSLSAPGRSMAAAQELRAIARAVRAHDADTAATLCAEHIYAASRTALASLESGEPLTVR